MQLAQAVSSWPAIWSAVAASFSALAALSMVWIHLQNRADAVRPELVLDGWSLTNEIPDKGIIQIGKISNQGRGSALFILGEARFAEAESIGPGKLFVGLFCNAIQQLPTGKEVAIDWHIKFDWPGSVQPRQNQYVYLNLMISTWDVHARRHEATYELVASRGMPVMGPVTNLSANLQLIRRYVRVRSRRRWKFTHRKNHMIAVVRRKWSRFRNRPPGSR